MKLYHIATATQINLDGIKTSLGKVMKQGKKVWIEWVGGGKTEARDKVHATQIIFGAHIWNFVEATADYDK